MDHSPGQLVGKMLWLVARYPEKPGVIMKLGSILKDPENLESSLNMHSIEAIPPSSQRDASLAVRNCVETNLRRNNSALIKATASIPVLTGITAGASADGHWKHDVAITVKAMDVKAISFIPSPEYMKKALKNDAVTEYARSNLFGKPLYIVVGVATAKKLHIKEKRSRENKASVSAHLNAQPVGEFEGKVSHENVASVEAELDVGDECDFAYRIKEFLCSKVLGLREKGDRTDKAMFGDGRSAPDEREEMLQFEWFEEEDVSLPRMVALPVSAQE